MPADQLMTGFMIQSYRPEEPTTPKDAQQILLGLKELRDSMEINSSTDLIIPPLQQQQLANDYEKQININNGFPIQVRTVGRKGQRFTKRINHPIKQGVMKSTSQTTAVQYEGAASSPHIKPELVFARMSSPSNFMRAKSISSQVEKMPSVMGQKITQQQRDISNQRQQAEKYKLPEQRERLPEQHQRPQVGKSANPNGQETAANPTRITQQQWRRSLYNQDLIASSTTGFNVTSFDGQERMQPRPIKSVERKRPHHIDLNLIKAQKRQYNKSGQGFTGTAATATMVDMNPTPVTVGLSNKNVLTKNFKPKSTNKLFDASVISPQLADIHLQSGAQLSDFMAVATQQMETQKTLKEVDGKYSDRHRNNDYDSNYYNANSTYDKRQTETENMAPTPNNLQPKLLSNRQSDSPNESVVSRSRSYNKTGTATSNLYRQVVSPQDFAMAGSSKATREHFTHTQPIVRDANKTGVAGATGFSQILKEARLASQEPNSNVNSNGVLLSSANNSTVHRTKSVISKTSPMYAQGVYANAAVSGFAVIAKKKEVVVNERVEQAHWLRKNNTLSKDAIKRQSMILNSLPMLSGENTNSSKPGTRENPNSSKPGTRENPTRLNQILSPMMKPDSLQNDFNTQETLKSSIDKPIHFVDNDKPPVTMTATDFHKNGGMTSPPLLTQNSPTFYNHQMGQKYEDHLMSLRSKREEIGLGTAHGTADMFDSQFKGGGSRPDSNDLDLTTISNWDQHNIQIGAKNISHQTTASQFAFKDRSTFNQNQQLPQQQLQHKPLNQQHFQGSFSLIPQNTEHKQSQRKNQFPQHHHHASSTNENYFQQWGHGKPTSTATIYNRLDNKVNLQQTQKYFERRSKSRAAGPASILMNNNKMRYKSQQRQLKGLQNLADLSNTQLQGIKVSRLNDLGQREDGNPLVLFNRLQQLQEQKLSSLDNGGVQTKVLAHFNAEAKAQVEAINDFTSKKSLYNTTQTFKKPSENVVRMPLKKLVGRQNLLMPDKLPTENSIDYAASGTTTTQVRHLKKDSRNEAILQQMVSNSQESNNDNVSVNMIQMLLNPNNKFGGGSKQRGGGLPQETTSTTYVVPLNKREDFKLVNQEGREKRRSSLNNDPKAVQATSFMMLDGTSTIGGGDGRDLSPMCNSIKLKARENHSRHQQKQQTGQTGKSRGGGHYLTLSNKSQKIDEQNKDIMAEMLLDMEQQEQILSSHGRGGPSSLHSNPEQKEIEECKVQTATQQVEKKKSYFSIQNTSQNRNETSDENGSRNALYPVGIMDMPRTPENELRRVGELKTANLQGRDQEEFDTMQVLSSDNPIKHQVYSRQDKSGGSARKRKEGSKEDRSDEQIRNASLERETLMEVQKDLPSGGDTSKQNSQKKNQAVVKRNEVTPLIGVTQVKIQKMKSVTKNNNAVEVNNTTNSDQIVEKAKIKNKEQNVYVSSEYMRSGVKSGARGSIEGQEFNLTTSQKSHKKGLSHGRSYQEMIMNANTLNIRGSANFQMRINAQDPGTLQQSQDQEQSYREFAQAPHGSIQAVIRYQNKLLQSQKMRSSVNSKGEDILTLISKKTTTPRKGQYHISRSGDRALAYTQTQQTESILEQMNVLTAMGGTQASGYHQLEPKLFPTTQHNFERAKHRPSAVPSETSKSRNDEASRNNTRTNKSRDSYGGGGKRDRLISPDAPSTTFDDDEMGYVSHKAIESRFQGHRVSKQVADLQKKKLAMRRDHKSVDETHLNLQNQNNRRVVAISNSPPRQAETLKSSIVVSQTQQVESPTKQQLQQGRSRSRAMRGSRLSSMGSGSDGHLQVEIDRDEARKVSIVDTKIDNCINIEKCMNKPIQKLHRALEDLIGQSLVEKDPNSPQAATATKNLIDSIESEDEKTFVSPRRGTKRRGLMKMDSLQIRQYYKDHFKYEFYENELYQLLKQRENATPLMDSAKKRYFLKFSTIQIVNVDCQSGLISDAHPINIPMSKMVNIFFLSKDQLQNVIAQSLCLRKEGNMYKLRIDQDQLRLSTYSTTPKVIRDDFFSAPLRVNIMMTPLEGSTSLIKESFSVEIRMPCFEILTTADDQISEHKNLFKTTMTHYLTGAQMFDIIKKHALLGWVDLAKDFISRRVFGLDQDVQEGLRVLTQAHLYGFDNKHNFVLHQDSALATMQEGVAKNIQLTLLMESNLSLQVEFLKPLFLKLKRVKEDSEVSTVNHEHLPGYLPKDHFNKQKAVTIASVQIPFDRMLWIQQSFGDRISCGMGSFMDCLHGTIQVLMDTKKGICRLSTPSWSTLEELNVRHLSQEYFKAQQRANQAQHENLKYLSKTMNGGVKQMFDVQKKVNLGNTQAKRKHEQKVPVKKDKDISSAAEMTCMSVPSPLLGQGGIEKADNRPRFVLVNGEMLCSLKLSPIDKVIHSKKIIIGNGSESQLESEGTQKRREKVQIDDLYKSQMMDSVVV